MFISNFHDARENGSEHVLRVSADQGHRFAKDIAGDYNPLHDADSKRFIVPGDLLFSLFLTYYGISRHMNVEFQGMVAADVELVFPALSDDEKECRLKNAKGHPTYLNVSRCGDIEKSGDRIARLIRTYVAYSGENFPHVLVPLMAEQGWMINTLRPLVLYQSMSLEMEHFDFSSLALRQVGTQFEARGKRAEVRLLFELHEAERIVGRGSKTLVAGGLRPYEEAPMQRLVDNYAGWKQKYLASKSA